MLFQETSRLLVGHLLALHIRLRIKGADNVPDFGPAVIICNHRSGMDPMILCYSVRNRYIHYGAAQWSYKIPVYKQFHQWGAPFLSAWEVARIAMSSYLRE